MILAKSERDLTRLNPLPKWIFQQNHKSNKTIPNLTLSFRLTKPQCRFSQSQTFASHGIRFELSRVLKQRQRNLKDIPVHTQFTSACFLQN